jgi:hypothetical protein
MGYFGYSPWLDELCYTEPPQQNTLQQEADCAEQDSSR